MFHNGELRESEKEEEGLDGIWVELEDAKKLNKS